jgi:hypothetical protein
VSYRSAVYAEVQDIFSLVDVAVEATADMSVYPGVTQGVDGRAGELVLAVIGVLLAAVEEATASNKAIDDEAVSDVSVEVATALVEVALSATAVAMLAPRSRKRAEPMMTGRPTALLSVRGAFCIP